MPTCTSVARHAALALALLAAGLLAGPAAADSHRPVFLDQNWDEDLRQGFYTTSQGSQLMPYDWFLALQRADGGGGFFADGLARHGYLPNPPSDRNRDGLPVGFVLDIDRSGYWVGMTCAACHTNQIRYGGTTMQIDGGPTQADFHALLVDIRDSVAATLADPRRFDAFARRVLRKRHSDESAATLRAQVTDFLEQEWKPFVEVSTTPVPWGRARLDAFGEIFNRVSAIDLDLPANNHPPDAPVSYPFLWNTSFEDKVQWNGSAENTSFVTRLARNTGEVLGVFGRTKLKGRSLLRPVILYYRTSARRIALLGLEARLRQLTAPRWPESILGSIDAAKAEAGKALYAKRCAGCHQVVPDHQQVKVKMTPVAKIGTDPRMASNACSRTVSAGRLAGVRMPPIPSATSLPAPPQELPAASLLGHVVVGALLEPLSRSDLRTLRELNRQPWFNDEVRKVGEALGLDVAKALESDVKSGARAVFMKLLRDRAASPSGAPAGATGCGPDSPLMAYKGRPLDGVWASPPYLHNGSVANLYEVLLPPEQRTSSFHVGSIAFDPVRVGFETTPVAGTTTAFDTSAPGNSRLGHDYGNASFSDEQRWQIVEYMKTL